MNIPTSNPFIQETLVSYQKINDSSESLTRPTLQSNGCVNGPGPVTAQGTAVSVLCCVKRPLLAGQQECQACCSQLLPVYQLVCQTFFLRQGLLGSAGKPWTCCVSKASLNWKSAATAPLWARVIVCATVWAALLAFIFLGLEFSVGFSYKEKHKIWRLL